MGRATMTAVGDHAPEAGVRGRAPRLPIQRHHPTDNLDGERSCCVWEQETGGGRRLDFVFLVKSADG